MSSYPGLPPCSILVIGLGNPLLGDDGFGWRAAEQVEQQIKGQVEVDYLAVGGLALMERLIGYEHVILIDVMSTGQSPVGSVRYLMLEDLPHPAGGHLSSAHDTTLTTAFEVGRSLGVSLPIDVAIVAVEAAVTFDFSDALTPPVAAAVPVATQWVIERLNGFVGRKDPDGIS